MNYFKEFEPIWADMDPNRHMRHSAYNDYGAQVRVAFFDEFGMGYQKMEALGVGAVLFREDVRFYREIRLGDRIKVDLQIYGLSPEGRFWNIVHHIYKNGDELSAVIRAEGAWIDLVKRKITIPPAEIVKHLNELPKSEDYQQITNHKKK